MFNSASGRLTFLHLDFQLKSNVCALDLNASRTWLGLMHFFCPLVGAENAIGPVFNPGSGRLAHFRLSPSSVSRVPGSASVHMT